MDGVNRTAWIALAPLAFVTACLVAACAPDPVLYDPPATSAAYTVRNPTVAYNVRSDHELYRAHQLASLHCSQYLSEATGTSVTENRDGTSTMHFECTIPPPTPGAGTMPIPIP
jgi:hypothetical protein